MLLKKVCTEHAIFEADDENQDFENILLENVEKFPKGPCNEVAAESVVDRKKKKRGD